MDKLRNGKIRKSWKTTSPFGILVSNIEAKIDELVSDFQNQATFSESERTIDIRVPYVEIPKSDRFVLCLHLLRKYGQFGGKFRIEECPSSNEYIVSNH